MKKILGLVVFVFSLLVCFFNVYAQSTFWDDTRDHSIYELRKLTEEDWLAMTTEDRIRAYALNDRWAPDQAFLGDFGRYYDMYKKWGYDYYEMEDRYESYAFRGFDNYQIMDDRRRKWSYDEFGDRVEKMYSSYKLWDESYSGDGTFLVTPPTKYLNAMVTANIDGVWAIKEGTNDWGFSAIAAGSIRKQFTPLTMSLPNINGIDLEFQSANNSFSYVSSSLFGLYDYWKAYGWLMSNRTPTAKDSDLFIKGGVLLRGGSFRRKLGALTLGATYVNEFVAQGNRQGGHKMFGTVSNITPTPMIYAVRFLDDSPDDNVGGATVYDVKLVVNGRYRNDIRPLIISDDVTRDRSTALGSAAKNYVTPPSFSNNGQAPKFDLLSIESNVPKYLDYIRLDEAVRGSDLKHVWDYTATVGSGIDVNKAKEFYQILEFGNEPIQVNGTKSVVFWFDISSIDEPLKRVEVEVKVANDYRVQTATVFTPGTTGSDTGGSEISGTMYLTWYNAQYWRTVAQAEGNIKDGSNLRTLRLDFGFQVASINYGFNADFNYRGFKIRGEYVINSNHYMFPDGRAGTGEPGSDVSGQAPRTGHKWSERDAAYYIITEKDWGKFGFSGELFHMGKFYRPYLDFYSTIEKGRWNWDPGVTSSRNSTYRLPLIEDNDDNDQYPDTDYVQRPMALFIMGFEDFDGVFPGNDIDKDGYPDTNKNNNGLPDYVEPFLMFDSLPDEFIYGNDFNNNSIPDFREDDMKLDTPYDLDRQGHHVSLKYSPVTGFNIIGGTMRTKGIGLDNRTNDDYLKFQVNYNVFDIGKFFAEYRYERIEDNIQDYYVNVNIDQSDWYSSVLTQYTTYQRYDRSLFNDPLEYRNSRVKRLYIDSQIRALPSVTLENYIKFENNGQIEGTMYDGVFQPEDQINTIAVDSKIVYTKRFGNYVFSPGLDYRLYKKGRAESVNPLKHYFERIPLVTLKYIISNRTDVTLGMQGIHGFEYRKLDYIQDINNARRVTWILQLQNESSYFGYRIWGAIGYTYDQVYFDKTYRKLEENKSTSTFVKVKIGW